MEDFRTYIGKKLQAHKFQESAHVKNDREPFFFVINKEMEVENNRIWSYENDRHPRHNDYKEFLAYKNIDLPDGKIDRSLQNNRILALEYWAWTWSGKKNLSLRWRYDLVTIELLK